MMVMDEIHRKRGDGMNILVIGAGAIGKLIAAQMARAGISLRLLVRRREQREAIGNQGIHLRYAGMEEDVQVPVSDHLDDFWNWPADVIILTVKSYHLAATAAQIAKFPASPLVLALQNGLQNELVLQSYIKRENILLGVCTHGATSLSDTDVAWNGVGEIRLGPLPVSSDKTVSTDAQAGISIDPAKVNAKVQDLTRILSAAGLRASLSQNIRQDVWRKALINCAINPVTALTRLENGELLQRDDLLRLMQEVIDEGMEVARLEGVPLTDVFPQVLAVCRQTARNRSSMLQDLLQGRPTEIDSLNGALVALAGDRCPLPVNRTLTALLRAFPSAEK